MAFSTSADSSSASWINLNCQHSRSTRNRGKGCVRAATAAVAKVEDKDKKLLKGSAEEHIIEKVFEGRKADESNILVVKHCERRNCMKGMKSRDHPSHWQSEGEPVLAMNGGRRRTFCSSQTELASFFSCTGIKVVSVEMPTLIQVHAVNCARKAYDSLKKFTSKTLALTLKKEFDGVYGPSLALYGWDQFWLFCNTLSRTKFQMVKEQNCIGLEMKMFIQESKLDRVQGQETSNVNKEPKPLKHLRTISMCEQEGIKLLIVIALHKEYFSFFSSQAL